MKKIKYLLLLLSIPVSALSMRLNMPYGVTPLSQEIYQLHMWIIYICIFIGIIVFSIAGYSLFFHRKSRGAVAHDFHENTFIEILWTVTPALLLIAIAIPATKVIYHIYDAKKADVNIKVTGLQWKWQYEYLDKGISFYSNLATPYAQIIGEEPKDSLYLLEVDKPIIVPIHKKIRFLVTSNDVNHSWWVPELGVKRDAIPGFINESWAWIEKPGIYRGQCTELCGVFHAYMPIVVQAVTQEEYDKWTNEQIASSKAHSKAAMPGNDFTAIMERGKKVYNRDCVACHQENGEGIQPMFPALRASSVAVGEPIKRHIEIIVFGVKGSAMQAFAEQLSNQEIADVVTYERNAWDNNTGDIVTAEDVAKVRAQGKPTMASQVNLAKVRNNYNYR